MEYVALNGDWDFHYRVNDPYNEWEASVKVITSCDEELKTVCAFMQKAIEHDLLINIRSRGRVILTNYITTCGPGLQSVELIFWGIGIPTEPYCDYVLPYSEQKTGYEFLQFERGKL